MCAFKILQKWPEMAKMTPDDLLALEMVFSEDSTLTRQEKINKTLLVL